jgi:hypothetical protein
MRLLCLMAFKILVFKYRLHLIVFPWKYQYIVALDKILKSELHLMLLKLIFSSGAYSILEIHLPCSSLRNLNITTSCRTNYICHKGSSWRGWDQ